MEGKCASIRAHRVVTVVGTIDFGKRAARWTTSMKSRMEHLMSFRGLRYDAPRYSGVDDPSGLGGLRPLEW